MKAIRVKEFGDPNVMKLEDVPDPKAGPGQVVVRVRAAGVNPVDAYIRSGMYGARASCPYTPGLDAGGIVEAVGDGVKNVKRGDRVFTVGTISGAYAELALCDAHRAHPLPDNVSFAQGAAITIPYGTAFRGLFHRAQAVAGEWVLVHGASGGVGIAGVQLARAPYMPDRMYASTGFTPAARTRTTTCPGPAFGSGTSSTFITFGSPNSFTRIAFMLALSFVEDSTLV